MKRLAPAKCVTAALFATFLFIGCKDGESKKEEPKAEPAKVETPAAPAASEVKDSLPPIDPNATSRPEDGKTK